MIIVSGGIDLSVGSIVSLSTVVTAVLLAAGLRSGDGRARRARRRGTVRPDERPPHHAPPGRPFHRHARDHVARARRSQGAGGRTPHRGAADLVERSAEHRAVRRRFRRADRASGSRCCWRCWSAGCSATRGSAGISSRSARTSGRRGSAACESSGGSCRSTRSRRCSPASPACCSSRRLSVGDPTVAVGLELDVIAAVIIGGGSLLGGKGTVIGTVGGRGNHGGDPDRLLAARTAQLGAADRHRHHHRDGGRAGSMEATRKSPMTSTSNLQLPASARQESARFGEASPELVGWDRPNERRRATPSGRRERAG